VSECFGKINHAKIRSFRPSFLIANPRLRVTDGAVKTILRSTDLIKAFLNDHPSDYDSLVQALQKQRDEGFPSLAPETSPISAPDVIEFWTYSQLAFIIADYSAFSNEAIHMLLDALVRDHDWPELKKEILQNIYEELGEQTKDVPHLEMMRAGYRIDLRIETDHVVHAEVTESFLRKMRDIFKHDDNAFSAGALLAFEGTAIAEFYILDKIVRRYTHLLQDDLKKGSLTNLYIDGHKYYEVGHEDGLRLAIKPWINASNASKFIKGYFSVLVTMSTWWEQLALEASLRQAKSELTINDTEIFNIQSVFKRP